MWEIFHRLNVSIFPFQFLRVVTILSKHVIAGYGSKSKTVKVSLVDQYSLKEPSCHWTGDSIPFQAIGQTDQIGSLMKTHNHDQEITVFDDYIPVKSKYVYFYPISCAQRSEGWVKCWIKVKRLCTTHPRKLSTFEWFCISSALPPNLHRKVCQKFAYSMFNLVGFVWSFLIVFW